MTLSTLKCAKVTATQKKLSIFVFQYGTISIPDDRLIGWFMIFNSTFNNISVISWRSVLLVEETGLPGENHRPVASKRLM